MTGAFILRLQDDNDFCLAIEAPSAGSPVVMKSVIGKGSNTNQWTLDPTTNKIISVANPQLCLDVDGGTVATGAALIVGAITARRLSQEWDWTTAAPQITSFSQTSLAVTTDCAAQDGNPVTLQATGGCQSWSQQGVDTVQG